MDKYLIAVDMDGTLLNSSNHITERSIRVLRRLSQQGHYIVPASGRAITLLPHELEQIERTYAITENGAVIWDYINGKTLFCEKLPPKRATDILTDAQEFPCYIEVFADGKAYIDERTAAGFQTASLGKEFIEYMAHDHITKENITHDSAFCENIEKINVYFEDEVLSKAFRQKYESDELLAVTTSISGNVEFNHKAVNKGNAVYRLRNMLEIDRAKVIAFGDNENDLEMFAEAGCAVAMANAGENIRKAADYVADDNDHDGVAKFLASYRSLNY